MIRICNPEPCPPRWEETAWSSCSASCGVGIQTRSVFCMRLLSVDLQDILTVSEDECREFKPAILQPCNQVNCPPAWETEPWQQCSQSCGGGIQVRKVYCKQLLSTGAYRRLGDKACSGAKPATNRSCSKIDCLPYMTGGEWRKCSVSCGLGIQHREPLCRQLTAMGRQVTLARELCSGLPSPPLVRTCRMMACPKYKKEMRPKDTQKVQVKVKQIVRRPEKARGYMEGVKQCPLLMGKHHIYIQTHKEKRLHLTVGGHAYLLPNTSLVIRCPVRRFPKSYIRWLKDGHPVSSSKRLAVTKSGSLKIHFLGSEDIGVYKCVAGPASDIFTLQLIGSDSSSRSIGRPSTASPSPMLEEMLPNCQRHYSDLKLFWPGVSVSLLPPGVQEASLQPRVEERLINITLQADRGEIQQEQASELLSSLLTHMSAAQLWTRTTEGRGQAKEFGWRFGDWSTCSASCGNTGTWLQRIHCVTLDGREVQPRMCQHIPKPFTSPAPCNRQDCPPRWLVSKWSKCSASCGSGWKQRQVSCQQLDASGTVRTLTAAGCERMSRPTDTERCTANNCPTWITSPWGKCSGRCVGSTTTVQKRSVTCQHTNGSSYTDCDLRDRPASVRNCSSDLCDVQWRPGAWRACTVVCGSGFQSRRVDCVHRRSGRTLADQHCAWLQRPSTWQHCNTATCGSECKDTNQYCSVVKRLKLCYVDMYKQRCCGSCSQGDDST